MKILIFGNPLVEADNLALKIMPRLREAFPQIEFIHLDPTEDLDKFGKKLLIIDTVINIKNPKVLTLNNEADFSKLSTSKITSMHDFDLGYNLKLLKKLDKIDSVQIICLPMIMEEKDALNQTQSILRKWVAQDMQGS